MKKGGRSSAKRLAERFRAFLERSAGGGEGRGGAEAPSAGNDGASADFITSLGGMKGYGMAERIRMHYCVRGRVQAVGFRYRAKQYADALGLTGFVSNNWDGSVTMEVQGTREEIEKLFSLLATSRYIVIEETDAERMETDPKESSFRIRDYGY